MRYEAVNAMLLNEFLKEHRNVQELKSTVAKQESTIAQQQKQIEALTTGLQKVSDQMDLAKAAPQLVANDHQAVLFGNRINRKSSLLANLLLNRRGISGTSTNLRRYLLSNPTLTTR